MKPRRARLLKCQDQGCFVTRVIENKTLKLGCNLLSLPEYSDQYLVSKLSLLGLSYLHRDKNRTTQRESQGDCTS
jgi:hypothetical protein